MAKTHRRPRVYVGMTIDFLHHGHINIISKAKEFGEVIVGLLTDEAVANYKRLPLLTYYQRKEIVRNINGVSDVVEQSEWDYAVNLRKYKPEYMMHGDDWLEGPLFPLRARALDALNEYGGKLIEVPYTTDISSKKLHDSMEFFRGIPDVRRGALRRLLMVKRLSRFIEAHNPLSALIAEKTSVEANMQVVQYDGFWSSSLTDSASRGKPDIEALEIGARLSNINDIFEVTTKPLIMDADTGGKAEHFEINVRNMERLGISATIIEDKTGLKKNSLFGNDVSQSQENTESFCYKLQAGKLAKKSDDFMIIARIESLILEKGMNDAIKRAQKYVEAGADGIMIHSRQKSPSEIFEFAKIFRDDFPFTPLVCVPTSYNTVKELELEERGFNIVIYANQLLRAAYPAMLNVAREILINSRSSESDAKLMEISEILKLIPGTE
jgi:phosphoenolpyruvate phosphomutase